MATINLPELSACYCAFGDDALAVEVYLLTVMTRESADPDAIAEAVRCWCVDDETLEAIEAYVLYGYIGYNVQNLYTDSACYQCVSPLWQQWIFLYLACQLASEASDCTPVLDEAGNPILDEAGNVICEESA